MNKKLRERIDESIQKKILSKNLLLLCLARLNEKILYSKLKYADAEKQRNIIAKTAIFNGVPKCLIASEIFSISKSDHPSDAKVKAISELCEKTTYSYQDDFIPDRWIHHKSEDEMASDALRKPVVKIVDKEQGELNEVVTYIEKEIMRVSLSEDMIKALTAIRTKEHSYSVILKTFQWNTNEILSSTRKPFACHYEHRV